MTAFFVYFVIPKIHPHPSFIEINFYDCLRASEKVASNLYSRLLQQLLRRGLLYQNTNHPKKSVGIEKYQAKIVFSLKIKLQPHKQNSHPTRVAVLYSNTFYHYYSSRCASQKVTTCSV